MTAAMSPIRITLAEARDKLKLSQAELSRRSGVPQQTISNIESGRTNGVDFSVLERLAKALGIENPLHLLRYEEEEPPAGKRSRG
jgi:transcriptional regulator with XRE-family HTH domain